MSFVHFGLLLLVCFGFEFGLVKHTSRSNLSMHFGLLDESDGLHDTRIDE